MLERERRGGPAVVQHVGDTSGWLLTNRRGALVLVAVLALAFGSVLGRPLSIGLADIALGDCLFIRTASARSYLPVEFPIGSAPEVQRALAAGEAERTDCDASHGHEVSAVVTLEGLPGAAYPEDGTLADSVMPTCEAAFAEFVGRAREGSAYDTVAVVPSRSGWTGGERRAVCLVFGRDGRFLDHQARGSGE